MRDNPPDDLSPASYPYWDERGWSSSEEEADKEKNRVPCEPGASRPAGWSDYQSAWLNALGGEDGAEGCSELAFALNKKSVGADATNKNVDDADEACGTVCHFSSFRATWRDVLDAVLDDAWYLEEVVGRKRWGAHGVKYLPKIDGVANYVLPVIHVELGIGNDINSYIDEGVGGVLGASKRDEEGCK